MESFSENLARINELARLKKERGLTEEETAEQARRRKIYLAAVREQFQIQLDHTVIQYEDGTKQPLQKKK